MSVNPGDQRSTMIKMTIGAAVVLLLAIVGTLGAIVTIGPEPFVMVGGLVIGSIALIVLLIGIGKLTANKSG